jgi:hypothetical protein
VDDLVTHIDRRAIFLQRALDNLDGTHDARAKPAGLGKIDFHGTPVTQLHQTLSASPPRWDVCNIRTTPVSASVLSPRRVEAKGFVSKNDRLEKADRKDDRPGMEGSNGKIIQYTGNVADKAPDPHLFVTLPRVNPGYISARGGFGSFCA